MSDLDQLGSFYLGREHDVATATTSDVPLLYKSKDLTTHAVCVGMTGSGKTGLCLSLLEEAALDGIPAICIDPKGDLGNLLLAFPDFDPAKFRPWIDESEAARKGQTPDEFAASTATMWKEGLAKWNEDGARVQKYCDSVERVIYTPGSTAGIPISVLGSFSAPADEVRDDSEALRDRVESAASGLLALVGGGTDPVNSREHILIANIIQHAWLAGEDLSIADIVERVLEPELPGDRVGSLPLEDFYPKKDRQKLAVQLNNLLASPSFAGWMEGVPLSIQDLLYSPAGKPRLSILSIAHLNDAERMFFVTILLNELLAWIRTQPGTSSLRAILYMDEVFGYFPPVAEPPSKRPMMTLLKQARAYGVGVVLATQNPVDLDYKGLSNCGTWLLGRLQTERDKARVIEGLQGASAEAGAKFDKQAMERTLSSLGNRVFLMNNVHDDASTVFNTRWAMSYLAGPLTQSQIKTLMKDVRGNFSIAKAAPPKPTREMAKGEEKPLPPTPPVVVAKRAAVDKEIEKLKKKQSDAWYQFVSSMGDLGKRATDYVLRRARKSATKRSESSLSTSLWNVCDRYSKWCQASAPLRPYVQHAKKMAKLERRLHKLQRRQKENLTQMEKVESELLELAQTEVVVAR